MHTSCCSIHRFSHPAAQSPPTHQPRGPDQICTDSALAAVTQTGRLSRKLHQQWSEERERTYSANGFGAHRATWVLVTKQNIRAYKHPKTLHLSSKCVFLFVCASVCGPLANDHHISIQNLIACLHSTFEGNSTPAHISRKWRVQRENAGEKHKKPKETLDSVGKK